MTDRPLIGLTRDLLGPDGALVHRDIGLDVLRADPAVAFELMGDHHPEVRPEQLRPYDAVISFSPRYTRASFRGADRLAALVRMGVGYDMVDVEACTEADVVLCITKGALSHSMAEAILAWMLALGHRILDKDRLLREGRWHERMAYQGCELRDRALGLVGAGGINGRLVELVRPFGMRPVLAYDPYVAPDRAAALGVTLAPLEHVMRAADFVSVSCPLTDGTRNLIGARELGWMKPEAYLINTARGGIVEEAPLVEALRARRLAGAAVDVFAVEPAGAAHPLAALDNVLLAPHCIGWTHEMFRDNGRMACASALAVLRGDLPVGVVNPEVLERPGFIRKLERLRSRRAAAAAPG
jgi:phosphoglycerate dehydrogenase-like enzyme